MRIVTFHLYNDYSGSPKVLRIVVEGLVAKRHEVTIVTSKTNGVLDELRSTDNIAYDYFHYHPSNNKFICILHFIWAQYSLFFKAFKHKGSSVFYINTIMPVGAAIAGKLLGKKIVFHYHENAFIKSSFYRVLHKIMLFLANEVICVSQYQRSFLADNKNIAVVYNALPKSFIDKLTPDMNAAYNRKNILMISSLLLYKGPIEFICLAQRLCEYNFTLVLNESEDVIKEFINNNSLVVPKNMQIYPRQSDVSKFYNNASILLNLSDRKKIIETFGMTVLEGMSAGLPVIVPTVGGVAELVKNGRNGYKIDVQELNSIASKIQEMLQDKNLYFELSKGALLTASKYSCEQMCHDIENILSGN